MNMNLDALGKKLHAKLDSRIDQLKEIKAHLVDVEKETEVTIQTKLKAAKETLETKKQEAMDIKAKLSELVEEKKAETEAAVASGKQTMIAANSKNGQSVLKNMLIFVLNRFCTTLGRPKWQSWKLSLPGRMLTTRHKQN